MFRPGNVDENAEPRFRHEIQEPSGRDVINAKGIGAQLPDLFQVAADLLRAAKRLAVLVRSKWPVRNSFYVELLAAAPKKLPIDDDPRGAWRKTGRHKFRRLAWVRSAVRIFPPSPGNKDEVSFFRFGDRQRFRE
jgi:hypothetical protein